MQRWLNLQRGLTTQFFLVGVLPLTVALIAVALVSQWLHQQAMRTMVAERDALAVRAAALAIGEQLTERSRSLAGLARLLGESDTPDVELARYDFVSDAFSGGLALYSPDGSLVTATAGAEAWADRPVAALLAHIDTSSPVTYSAAFVTADERRLVLLAAAVGEAHYVVGAVEPATLVERVLAVGGEHGAAVTWALLGADGQVLFETGSLHGAAPGLDHPGVAEALRGETGTRFMPGPNGQEHVVGFGAVAPTGWALVSEEPWDEVEGPVLRNTLLAPLILVPAVVLGLLIMGFGLRQIVQPLRALEQKAAELGQGHYDAIEQPVGGIGEIQRLQTELGRMAGKVKSAQESLRGYLGAMTAGQEEERRRLARELHDDTVQALIALDQRAQMAQRAAADSTPAARERLTELRAMTSALIDDLRRVIRALRPIYLEDLGLLPAIEMLARDVGFEGGYPAAFSVSGPVRRLTPAQEIGLYRIVQEALHNAARHAEARSVTVAVTFTTETVGVEVADDGRGFSVPDRVNEQVTAGHFGLMGMQERAELIGARLEIRSAPGRGTVVAVRLPIDPAPQHP